jgi:uncharacterized lipoprotein YajG
MKAVAFIGVLAGVIVAGCSARAEFQRVKPPAAAPDPRPALNDRTRTLAFDRYGDEGHQG